MPAKVQVEFEWPWADRFFWSVLKSPFQVGDLAPPVSLVLSDDNHIWSVQLDRSGEDLRFGSPESLFSVRVPLYVIPASTVLAVSRDGAQIYCLQSIEQPDSDVINVRTGLWK